MAESESVSDGLLALSEDEDLNDEHYGGFLQSLHRMKKGSVRQKQDTTHELLKEGKKAVDAKASEIYLRKELAATHRSPKDQLQTGAELDQTISYLQQCSINAAGVHFAVQQSVINAQLQENFQQQLQSAQEENLSPDLLDALGAGHPALSLAASVAKRIAAVEAKKQLRRQRRIELAVLYRRIDVLWQEKEQRDLTRIKKNDSELMKIKREKLREFEGKLDVVVHILQTIKTGLSPQWGTNEQYLNVLKACELYINSRQATNWEQISALLTFAQPSAESSE